MRRIILLLLLTVTITSTQAQSTDAEARRVVSEAFSALDEGYTFTRDGENTQTFYQDDEVVFTSYNSETSTGEVAANGDYHRSLTARSAEAKEDIVPALQLEITSVDDDVYVNVVGSPLLLISFPVEMGWWRYDDLLAQFGDDSAVMLGFQALVENAQFPHSLPVEDDLILSVTEQAPEVIDDVEMRVFMLEMDAQFILLRSTGATEEEIQDYLEDEDNADFLAASQQTIMYRLWIGADDGLLYQGEGEGYSYMPYDSTDQFGVDYDIESEFTFSFTITGYGNTEAITAPDELHSGE